MKRAVILRHTLPDGSWHYDWLVQRSANPDDLVPTFRTDQTRPDQSGSFEAEQIGDHRALYLDHEGEVSGGRGEVARIVTGEVRSATWADDYIGFEIRYPGEVIVYLGEHLGSGRWNFTTR
ncbi:MAG: hypothetical protein ED559_05405 [Phycisphaera sp.]|nr:MAG: hypothetical protein ED559_05405 [Phycisphaera sp.]